MKTLEFNFFLFKFKFKLKYLELTTNVNIVKISSNISGIFVSTIAFDQFVIKMLISIYPITPDFSGSIIMNV